MGQNRLSVVAFPCFRSGKFNCVIGDILGKGIGKSNTYDST